MLAKQRYAKILELLEKDGIVHTAELVKLMGVSSETVRKDLEYLDTQGRLSRVHGGAVPISMGNTPDMIGGYISLQMRNSQHLNQKGAITRKAAELVKEGQVIALDYGSTSQIMALALRERFQHITVVTNSIQNALLLADNPGITIILIGGVLNRDEFTLVNEFSSILENIHIDIMFMTVTGIDCGGLYGPEAERNTHPKPASQAGQQDHRDGGLQQVRQGQPPEDLFHRRGGHHCHRHRTPASAGKPVPQNQRKADNGINGRK